jgi:CspA family cold shock protein
MIRKFLQNLFGNKKANETKEGTVKFFNKTKGFGFISIKDSDDEIFVHKTGLISKIRQNDKVIFEVEKSEKGLHAVKVRKL